MGLSGGIDSCAVVALLLEQGHTVHACFLDTGFNSPVRERVEKIAQYFFIPITVYTLQEPFDRGVVAGFKDYYLSGLTPNPCVNCNVDFKFYWLRRLKEELGFDAVATGHYARIGEYEGRPTIAKGVDLKKDQSYFLYRLIPTGLSDVLFPLGDKDKGWVRRYVGGRVPWLKPSGESQDLCFVGDKDYKAFLMAGLERDKDFSGKIVDIRGRVLGEHRGYFMYTPGQRSGLSLKEPGPWYVVRIVPESRTVVVAKREEAMASRLTARLGVYLEERSEFEASAKIRYNQPDVPVRVVREGDRFEVVFVEKQLGVAPGQHVVIYKGDKIVAGGEIESVSYPWE